MKEYSSLELAFLGDAIHTLFVRSYALQTLKGPMNAINKFCAAKCSATHQSAVLQSLTLTDEESEIVRKARNAKAKHTAKNAEVKDYKLATAYEALVAHLHLTNQTKRLEEVLALSLQ